MTCQWQVEVGDYATKVLEKHWPDVRRFRDVRDCGAHNLEAVDLICGGFPCQDVSLAGKRAGLSGKRSTLWSEFARIIRELRPRWVLAENVPGLYSSDSGRFFGRILRDLAESGYDAEWDCIPAAAVGAPHRRYRVFIVAYAQSNLWRTSGDDGSIPLDGGDSLLADAAGEQDDAEYGGCERLGEQQRPTATAWPEAARQTNGQVGDNGAGRCGQDVAHASGTRLANWRPSIFTASQDEAKWRMAFTELERCSESWWAVEPDVGRVAHGVPNRIHRLKCLGNAVVPQLAEWIGRRIMAQIEVSPVPR